MAYQLPPDQKTRVIYRDEDFKNLHDPHNQSNTISGIVFADRDDHTVKNWHVFYAYLMTRISEDPKYPVAIIKNRPKFKSGGTP